VVVCWICVLSLIRYILTIRQRYTRDVPSLCWVTYCDGMEVVEGGNQLQSRRKFYIRFDLCQPRARFLRTYRSPLEFTK